VTAAGTLGTACIAALAARESHRSAQAANAAASMLAEIERDRRYDELTPRFDITCQVRDIAPDSADLLITLARGGAQYLDWVTVTILDEARQARPEQGPLQEAEELVWGAWEFSPEDSSQVVSKRESRPRPYSRLTGENQDLLRLRATEPGPQVSGISSQAWRDRYGDRPLRLRLTCKRNEHQSPWVIQRDVNVEHPPTAS
jgi:hypothetical protein